MHNFYSSSENIMNKECRISDEDDDDNDYENVSDGVRVPAVPSRKKREDLKLKALNKHVSSNQTRENLSVITERQPESSFQPPPIGLDLSSSAVNAAFTLPPGNENNNIRTELKNIKRFVGLCKSCPTEWNLLDSTCYYFSKSHQTWEASKRDCTKLDSSLLILNNKKELDKLLPLTGNKRFWIGLKRYDNKEWKWIDGTLPTFTNWNPHEPNNYGSKEHCTEMITGGWNDLDCSNNIDYICKKLASC
ncbi:CD209 antigen-like protein C [Gastrophryne carolinensis]